MKKFFSAILLMAAMAFSVSTFVSCNDLTQEMEDVKAQATQNAAAIDALETQITALQSALATAQATADAAKKAGEDAAAAAAQAKADAIKEAKAECEIVKAALEAKIAEINTALAGKASKEELQAAIDQATAGLNDLAATLGAKIEGIEAGLNKMATVAQLNEEVAKLLATDQELALQIAALKAYSDTTYATVEEAEAIREELTNLANENYNELYKLIGGNASAITALTNDQVAITEALKALIDANTANIDELAGTLAAAGDDIAAIEEALKAYMPETDAKIAENAQKIADLNELLDLTVEQVAERINGVEANMKAYYDALTASVADLGTELRAEIAKVKTELEGKITTAVNDLNNAIAEKYDPEISTLKTLVKNLLRSIEFVPATFIDGVEALEFNSLVYAPMKAEPADAFQTITKANALSLSEVTVASYHFNPSSFNLDDAQYQYIATTATNKLTKADDVNLYNIEKIAKNGKNVDVTIRRNNVYTTTVAAPKYNMIALEATLKDGNNQVTSPYVIAKDNTFGPEALIIADKKGDKIGTEDHLHFATTFALAKPLAPQYTLVWDGTLDLRPLVTTCFGAAHADFNLAAYGLDYRFYVASSKYDVPSGQTTTNQQDVLVCTDNVKGTFQVAEGINKESIGRTPIVKIELVDAAGNIVRRAYVKILVGVEREADKEFAHPMYKDVVYMCADTKVSYEISEQWMRENVYRLITNRHSEVSLSHEEFWNLYDAENAVITVKKNNKVYNMSKPEILDGYTEQGTATKKIVWNFTHGELGTLGQGGASFEATVTVANKLVSSEYPAKVTFKMNFKAILPTASIELVKNEEYWNAELTEYVINPSIPSTPQAKAEEFFYARNILEAFVNKPDAKIAYDGKPYAACHTEGFRLASVSPILAGKGVGFAANEVTLDKASDAVKAAVNNESLMVVFEYFVEYQNGDEQVVYTFPATFVKPVNYNLPAGLEVTDALDGGDVVEFGWNGLLTDWRGFAIISPDEEIVEKTYTSYSWIKDCAEQHFTEGYYKLANQPKFDVIWGEYTVEGTTVYTASVEATRISIDEVALKDLLTGNFNADVIKPITETFTGAAAADKAQALANLEAAIEEANEGIFAALRPEYKYFAEYAYWYFDDADVVYTPSTTGAQTVKYIMGYDVVLPEYEYVAPQPIACTEKPADDVLGDVAGQRLGCWVWTPFQYTVEETNPIPGQYYDFYGPFNGPVLELDKVKTDLEYNGGKLPSGVTLQQVGNTVKYVNVGSPVRYAYNITIPTYVEYGFGKLTATLVIKVNPINE